LTQAIAPRRTPLAIIAVGNIIACGPPIQQAPFGVER